MIDIATRHIDAGDESTNIIGDGNSVLKQYINSTPSVPIRHSYLYEVCRQIIDSDLQSSEDFSIESNAAWLEKLKFNNVSDYYIEIFDNDSYAYEEVAEIMANFPNRDTLIRKVHNIYLAKEKQREQISGDGDFVLKEVFEALEAAIQKHEDSLEERTVDEERDRSIWLLMFYVFTLCQLLRKPVSV